MIDILTQYAAIGIAATSFAAYNSNRPKRSRGDSTIWPGHFSRSDNPAVDSKGLKCTRSD
jgi:hypothetical protein